MVRVSGMVVACHDRDSAINNGGIPPMHPMPTRKDGTSSVALAVRGEDRLGKTLRPREAGSADSHSQLSPTAADATMPRSRSAMLRSREHPVGPQLSLINDPWNCHKNSILDGAVHPEQNGGIKPGPVPGGLSGPGSRDGSAQEFPRPCV